ncbi:MAG: murein hydrolase activator EnvC family protein [Coriobacteriia bacterium]
MKRPRITCTFPGPRIAVAVVLVFSLAATVPAMAAPSKVDRLQNQLADIRADLKKAGSAYDKAFWKLDETEVRIDKIDARIEQGETELADARVLLGSRVNGMYRAEQVDYLSVLLDASSFDEMVTRLEFIRRVNQADADAIERVENLQAKLSRDRAKLQAERADRQAAVTSLKKQRDKLQKGLKAKKAEYDRVAGELNRARGGSGSSGARSMPGPNGMVFPVRGANYYSNTWGASRSGGRRSHKGTDIMAARGTPCVAVLSGTVRAKSSSLGGKTIWLTADNGWQFYYAHLNGYQVTSGRVSAGQVIGSVGDTGNARGGSPHLHFEIHPGGGAAVNPYSYLRRMQ